MEKLNFVKDGVLRFPPGFRFHPTDEELIVQYLKRKVLSYPLPASIIPEFDRVCNSDPWNLPGGGDVEQERYFFSTREVKYRNGNRSNRATSSGYWKATGIDKRILSVGMKKTLVFYRGKPPNGSRTDWIMHEYRLANVEAIAAANNWVICRIFLKKRNKNNEADFTVLGNTKLDNKRTPPAVFYNFIMAPAASSSSSSGCSGITQVSSHESGDHEESSSSNCNSFTTFRTKPWP